MSFVSKFKKISYSDIIKKFHHPQNSQCSVKRSLASISTEKSSITLTPPKRNKKALRQSVLQIINESKDRRTQLSPVKVKKSLNNSVILTKRKKLEDISFYMKRIYLNKTKHQIGDKENSKLKAKFVDVNNFRHKIIKDYVCGSSKEEIEHAKINYNKIMEYMELEKEFKKKKVLSDAAKFYDNKRFLYSRNEFNNDYAIFNNDEQDTKSSGNSFNGMNEMYVKICVDKINRMKMKKIKEKVKDYADSFKHLDGEYEELDERTARIDPYRINYHNLNRQIDVQILQRYKYDIHNDYLCEKNPNILRQFGRQVEFGVIKGITSTKPKYTKEKFNKTTIIKFKGVTGKYFGFPV